MSGRGARDDEQTPHGDGVDPYAWLQDDSPETRRWEQRQLQATEEHLTAWPGHDALLAAVRRYRLDPLPVTERRGDVLFTLNPGGGPAPAAISAQRPDGPPRVLVDSGMHGDDRQLLWFVPSPDGSAVAYAVARLPDERCVIHVVDADGRQRCPGLATTTLTRIAWLPDSRSFLYADYPAFAPFGPGPDLQPVIVRYELDAAGPSAPEPLELDGYLAFPEASPDHRWLLVYTGTTDVRPAYIRAAADGHWRPFLPAIGGDVGGVVADDSYFAVVTAGAPRGRLVEIPLDAPDDPSRWSVLVEESDLVLRSVYAVGDLLVVHALDGLRSQLLLFERDGRATGLVPLPGAGQVVNPAGGWITRGERLIASRFDATAFEFWFTTFDRSPARYRFDTAADRLDQVQAPQLVLADLRVTCHPSVSSDGTAVPTRLVYRGDLSGPRPVLVHAYGGFRYPMLPDFIGPIAAFLDAGGVYVTVAARGGGEFGDDWWHDGRRARKEQTFIDVFTAVEQLVGAGIADRERVAFFGASNGGLLAGACATQRPGLFRAVVALVPLLDMLGFVRDPLLRALATTEYGDPRDPRDVELLRRYSPYHRVLDGVEAPAILVVAGAVDPRVPAWHARKFVAALQDRGRSPRPALLRIVPEGGHGLWRVATADSAVVADWLGFVMRELGLEPAAAPQDSR